MWWWKFFAAPALLQSAPKNSAPGDSTPSCSGDAVGTVDVEGMCFGHCPGDAQADEQDEKPEGGAANVAGKCEKWRSQPHEQQLADQWAYMDFLPGRGYWLP